jgi:hypothetical protein
MAAFQLELKLPGDRRREFVLSVDTAHIRSADPKSTRNFELLVAMRGQHRPRSYFPGSPHARARLFSFRHDRSSAAHRFFLSRPSTSDANIAT